MTATKQGEEQSKLKNEVFKPTIRLLITNYFEHDVGKNAAALAYHLDKPQCPIAYAVCNWTEHK